MKKKGKNIEEVICLACHRPFDKRIKGIKGGRGVRGKYIRPANAKTCSPKCSSKLIIITHKRENKKEVN